MRGGLAAVWETQMAVDAALYSGSKCYFFDGDRYIRVTRGDTGAGTVDPGYPAPISDWGWPGGFGARDRCGAVLGLEVLLLHGEAVHPGDPW